MIQNSKKDTDCKKMFVAVSGLATSGKDTCCKFLIQALSRQNISAARMALADQLKAELRGRLLEKFGIDVLNCTPKEKEVIRPSLVEHGRELRVQTQGTHWTKIVQERAQNLSEQVIIVPDIRYNHYPNDEVQWIKQNNGLLIHVSRYIIDSAGNKSWVQPPNEDERINDPTVRVAADFVLSWETLEELALKERYNGFFDTIASIIKHELSRLNR